MASSNNESVDPMYNIFLPDTEPSDFEEGSGVSLYNIFSTGADFPFSEARSLWKRNYAQILPLEERLLRDPNSVPDAEAVSIILKLVWSLGLSAPRLHLPSPVSKMFGKYVPYKGVPEVVNYRGAPLLMVPDGDGEYFTMSGDNLLKVVEMDNIIKTIKEAIPDLYVRIIPGVGSHSTTMIVRPLEYASNFNTLIIPTGTATTKHGVVTFCLAFYRMILTATRNAAKSPLQYVHTTQSTESALKLWDK
jgi:hypothetical protein